MGFYSDFHPFREAIKAYPDDVQVLIVADEGEKYGNNWLLCVTPAARESQLKIVADREAAKKAIEDAKQAEIDRKKAEEAALLTRVWKDEPLLPRPWANETSAETLEELRRQNHTTTSHHTGYTTNSLRCNLLM